VRRLLLAVLVVAVLGGAGFGWARLFADPPIGPIPGGSLRGEPAPPPADWSIAEGIQHLPVEHLGGGLPWSTRTWFILYQGRIHLILPSLFGRALQDRLLETPRVRVRIDGRLYEQRATLVDVAAVYSAALPNLARRQFAIEVEGEVRPLGGSPPVETWIWRLDDPPSS
jgi:hypothetical protein